MVLAFVTCEKLPHLTDDDRNLALFLEEKGWSVEPVIWDDPAIHWQGFDLIVLRSMWDYFEKPVAFDTWLDSLEKMNCKVLNPVSVVRWNQNKRYFDDYVSSGANLPAYVIVPEKSNISLTQILNTQGWKKAVVKPLISGGAYHTWIITADTVESDESRFDALCNTRDMIVQIFVDEIITRGEVSLIFLNKKFSHAILKKVAPGDFRVQPQYGGTTEAYHPSSELLHQAQSWLDAITEPLLYARVDGVLSDNGTFLLMELELIEPNLSFFMNDQSMMRFYEGAVEIMSLTKQD